MAGTRDRRGEQDVRPPTAPDFLAILGPTGSGKTALSLALAREMDVEVISMDSRQVYRGMDIGTGKVTREERAAVPHFGLDLIGPSERYSAGRFSRDAREWISEIRGRGRVPLLVGGTGFFLKALTDPMFREPPLDPARLEALRGFLNGMPVETLYDWVAVLDPDRAEAVREGGRQRATRTAEIALLTGRPLSWWHRREQAGPEPLRGLVTVLDLPREALYSRINERVGRMVEEGLVEEVRGLLEAGVRPDDPGMTGAGYREVVAFLRGDLTLEQAIEAVRTSHRRYARRQMTWNRHQLPEGSVYLDGTRPPGDLLEQIRVLWQRESGHGTTTGRQGTRRRRKGEEQSE